MRLSLSLALVAIILSGCTATTPLLVAEVGGHQIARSDEDIRVKAAAALAEEPDLITFSIQAISRNKTNQAAAVYMQGYDNPEYSEQMKSMAIYQIALMYMNRFNEQEDDAKAALYFQRHLKEFPDSILKPRIIERLAIIEKRRNDPIKLSSAQLLRQVDRAELLKRNNIPYDSELTPMSERAISEGRVNEAEQLYMIVYNNKASSDEIRAKSLYQIGLMYMSPYNAQNNNLKALETFRKINNEFPNSDINERVSIRITEVLNLQ